MKPPAVVPDLTDVYADADEPPLAAPPSVPDSRWRDEPTVMLPVVAGSLPQTERIAPRPSQRTVLFGFVGGAAVLLAVLLWPRAEHPSIPPVEAPATTSLGPADATSPNAPPVVAAPAPVLPPADAALESPAHPDTSGSAIATARPAPMKEPAKTPERRLTPEAQIAAQPPAAGPATRSPNLERKPAVRSAAPPAPTLECTPQVDALGLCAPGAKVADRAGSR